MPKSWHKFSANWWYNYNKRKRGARGQDDLY